MPASNKMKKASLIVLAGAFFCSQAIAGITFNGTTTLLTCGSANTVLTENGAVTISAWIKPTTVGENNAGRIIEKALGTSTNGLSFVTRSTATLGFGVIGSTPLSRIASNNTLTLGTIQHVLVTWDGSTTAANVHIYLNGSEVSYATTTNMVTPTDNAASDIHIGNDSTTARTFNGTIYEVAVWNTALGSSDIASVYNAGVQGFNMRTIQPSNLISWWRLNECAEGQTCNTTYADEIGSNNCTGSNNPVGVAARYTSNKNSTLKAVTLKG